MIVCQCRRVSDREVRAAVERGARTVDDLAAACGAGGDCRGCHPNLEAILEKDVARPPRGDRRRLQVVAV